MRFAGGRKEEATYDAGDEEDKQIAAAVRKESERRGGEGEVHTLSSASCMTTTTSSLCVPDAVLAMTILLIWKISSLLCGGPITH